MKTETQKQKDKEWYMANRDRISAEKKQKRLDNLEIERQKDRDRWPKRKITQKEYSQAYRDTHREEQNIRNEKYRKQNWGKLHSLEYRFNHSMSQARKRGKEVTISFGEIALMPLVCHYTGEDLTLDPGQDNTVSFERIDSSLGYISGNVVLAGVLVNIMKSDHDKNKFIEMCGKVFNFSKVKGENK